MPAGFFLVLSALGSQAALSGYIAIYYWWTGQEVRRLVLLMGTTLAINLALKSYFDLPRPEGYFGLAGLGTETASFPSGHAQAAGSFFTYWGLKRGGWTWVLVIAAAVSISYSRVGLGVHYPRDVIAGLVIGAVLAFPFARFTPMPDSRIALGIAMLLLIMGALVVPGIASALGIVAAGLVSGFADQLPATPRPKLVLCALGVISTLIIGAGFYQLLGSGSLSQFLLTGLLVAWALRGWPWLYRRIFV